jgi:hypothetical protein
MWIASLDASEDLGIVIASLDASEDLGIVMLLFSCQFLYNRSMSFLKRGKHV